MTLPDQDEVDALRRDNAELRAELDDLRDAHDLVLDYLEVVLAERDRYRRAVDGVRELVPASVQRLLAQIVRRSRP